MKKLSLLIVFVMLFAVVFAFSASAAFVRGEEGQTITMDNVESVELISGSNGHGNPSNVIDGKGDYWGGPAGSAVKITFVNEWEISTMSAYLIQNWSGCRISLHAADDTELAAYSEGNQTYNTGYIWGGNILDGNASVTNLTPNISNVPYGDNDKAVKYVVLKCTQDKWGYLTGFGEIVMVGRERIPSKDCVEHSFIEVCDPEPTCTTPGYKIRVCENCGAEEAPSTVPALGHKYDSYEVLPPESCLETPKIQFTCLTCGEVSVQENHIKDVTDRANLANVYIEGSGSWTNGTMFDNDMEKFQQASSGWYLLAEVELDQAYYISSVTVWTGYDSGYSGDWKMTFYYMSPDGTEWIAAGTKQIPPTIYEYRTPSEHVLVLDAPVYASAVKIRVDSITHGSGIVFEAEVAGSYLPDTVIAGHKWEAGEVVAPTCVHRGYTTYTCTACGETKMDDFVINTGVHTYVPVLEEKDEEGNVIWTPTEATCTEAGNKKDKCEVCGNVKETNIDPLGHDMQDATCTAPATCKVCGYTEGEVLDHNYVAGEQAEDGSVTYTCSNCNDAYVINNSLVNGEYYLGTDLVVFNNGALSAMGSEFTYTYNVTTGMIDTDAGIFFQVIDGVIYFKGAQPLHQHNENTLSTDTTDATCTTDGVIVTICQFCGPIAEETIEATGHVNSYDDDAYVYEGANCTTEGYEKDICANCGEEFTVVLPIEPDNHMADWDTAEYKDATCQEDGYEKYTCLFCEQTITIVYESNEDAHVWDEKLGVYVPATCKDAGYEYKKCSLCGFESNEEFGPYESAHKYDDGVKGDGVIVYTCTLCDYSYEEEIIVYPELPLGDSAIEIVAGEWGWTNSVYYSVSVPGNYVLTFDVNDNINLILGEYSNVMLETSPYEFTVNEGEVVTFTFMTFDFEAGTVNVNLAAKVSHVHVEEVIPAVLPTPSNPGTTAGVRCSDCGEVLVAPVENVVTLTPTYKTFGINSTNLILGNNISLDYKVNVSAGYELLYMVFVFEDVEYVVSEYKIDGGKPLFNFAETRPHKMATNISAYAYAKTADGYSYDVYDYSVMKYCIAKLKKNENVNVISDLLEFGAATQKYVAAMTNTTVAEEDLITSLVKAQGYTLTPTAFTSIPKSLKAQYVDIDANDDFMWQSSTVVLGSSTEMVYKFTAKDITGLQIKITVDGVEKMILDASDLEYDAATKRYVVSVNCVSAVQYGSEVKATFIINGVESDSVAYSINGFLYNNLSKNEGTVLGDLMKALYVYGDTTYSLFYQK